MSGHEFWLALWIIAYGGFAFLAGWTARGEPVVVITDKPGGDKT